MVTSNPLLAPVFAINFSINTQREQQYNLFIETNVFFNKLLYIIVLRYIQIIETAQLWVFIFLWTLTLKLILW